MLLPDSREKIADLEAIRDSFEIKEVMPKADIESQGIPSESVIGGDSITYRSKHFVKGRELARAYAKNIFLNL